MARKLGFFAIGIIVLSSCTVRKTLSPTPISVSPSRNPLAAEKAAEAGSLLDRGGYIHLRHAFALFREVEELGPMDAGTAEKYLQTALLLDVRAKDLGVFDDSHLKTARRLIETYPGLASYQQYDDLVSLLRVKVAGVVEEAPASSSDSPIAGNLAGRIETLKKDAASDPVRASLLAALWISSPIPGFTAEDLHTMGSRFPDSLFLKFQISCLPPGDTAAWNEILTADPEYVEVLAARGGRTLAEKKMLSAEPDLLKAHEAVPESPLLPIQLASISFALEEYDQALDFFEKTLRAKADYREAELGRAICLSCLGRAAEAVPILNALITDGPSLRGECYFWLATNQREMSELAAAAESIEAAKPLLPRSQVFTLSGLIALERSLIDQAEADFKTAVKLNAGDEEAFFNLGRIYAQKTAWTDSGLNFMMAGYGYEQRESELENLAGQIREASLAAERKERLLERKKIQIEKTRLKRATAYYNAAAGFYNGGDPVRARPWAEKSTLHPQLIAKARDFLALLDQKR